jgi:hypothetical protein
MYSSTDIYVTLLCSRTAAFMVVRALSKKTKRKKNKCGVFQKYLLFMWSHIVSSCRFFTECFIVDFCFEMMMLHGQRPLFLGWIDVICCSNNDDYNKFLLPLVAFLTTIGKKQYVTIWFVFAIYLFKTATTPYDPDSGWFMI